MTPGTRKVLIVAYHYPPAAGSSGIQRTLKFSAYLRHHGWEPIVLTADPRAHERVDNGQLGDIPPGLQIERAFALDTAKHLSIGGRYLRPMSIPDRWVSWWPAGVWRGLQIIRQQRPSVIMSTFPIPTAHMIALTLARLSGLPWVADFRDNMTDPEFPRDPMTWRFNRWLEGAVVRHCTKAVFTTQGALEMYAERYPAQPKSLWAIIENGYDEDNFIDAESGLDRRSLGAQGQLTLIHSGVLYPEERDPEPFFAALATLKCAGEISASTLQVVLRASGNEAEFAQTLAALDIADIVQLAPAVAYRDALREMLCADGLLLFQAAMCNHQIPAKLYEYLRAGQPILALTDPAGNTAEALRAARAGSLCDITDAEAIAKALRAFIGDLRSGAAAGASRAAAELHSRRARTAELATLLDNIRVDPR
ncbi:MAG: glycosyltransferase [Ideonella sp.]|nr:glycosyltransferase [Ideonella sp.]